MKKVLSTVLTLTLVFALAIAFTGCGSSDESLEIAVPNDTTNEARALLLLQDQGIITLADGVGITATVKDRVDNPAVHFSKSSLHVGPALLALYHNEKTCVGQGGYLSQVIGIA